MLWEDKDIKFRKVFGKVFCDFLNSIGRKTTSNSLGHYAQKIDSLQKSCTKKKDLVPIYKIEKAAIYKIVAKRIFWLVSFTLVPHLQPGLSLWKESLKSLLTLRGGPGLWREQEAHEKNMLVQGSMR